MNTQLGVERERGVEREKEGETEEEMVTPTIEQLTILDEKVFNHPPLHILFHFVVLFWLVISSIACSCCPGLGSNSIFSLHKTFPFISPVLHYLRWNS
jgi:hypothetical protein